MFLVIIPLEEFQHFNQTSFEIHIQTWWIQRQHFEYLFGGCFIPVWSVSIIMKFCVNDFQIVLVGTSPPWFWNFMMFVEFFHFYWNLKSNRHFSFNIVFQFSWSCLIVSSTSSFISSRHNVFDSWWNTSTSLIHSILIPWSIAFWNMKSSPYQRRNLSSIFHNFSRTVFVVARACHEILLSLYLNHSSFGVLKTGLTILFSKCSWIILSKFLVNSTSSLITNTFSFDASSNAWFHNQLIFLSVFWMNIFIVQSFGFHFSWSNERFWISYFQGLSNKTNNSILFFLHCKMLFIVLFVKSVRL